MVVGWSWCAERLEAGSDRAGWGRTGVPLGERDSEVRHTGSNLSQHAKLQTAFFFQPFKVPRGKKYHKWEYLFLRKIETFATKKKPLPVIKRNLLDASKCAQILPRSARSQYEAKNFHFILMLNIKLPQTGCTWKMCLIPIKTLWKYQSNFRVQH